MQQISIFADQAEKSSWICTAEYHHIICREARIPFIPRRLLDILLLISQEISAAIMEEKVWKRLHLYNRSNSPLQQWAEGVHGRVIFDRHKGAARILLFGLFVARTGTKGKGVYQRLSVFLPPMWAPEGRICSQYETEPVLFSPQGICLVCECGKGKHLHVIYRPFILRHSIVFIHLAGRKFISFPYSFWAKQSLPKRYSPEGLIPSVM